jgi:hypothetical protein
MGGMRRKAYSWAVDDLLHTAPPFSFRSPRQGFVARAAEGLPFFGPLILFIETEVGFHVFPSVFEVLDKLVSKDMEGVVVDMHLFHVLPDFGPDIPVQIQIVFTLLPF